MQAVTVSRLRFAQSSLSRVKITCWALRLPPRSSDGMVISNNLDFDDIIRRYSVTSDPIFNSNWFSTEYQASLADLSHDAQLLWRMRELETTHHDVEND